MKFFYLPITIILIACNTSYTQNQESKPVNHSIWDQFLKKHVDDNGLVAYRNAIHDSSQLAEYIQYLGKNGPNDKYWNKEEQLSYWINLYNSATIQLILRNYPLESIRDIGSKIQIPFVNTPWQVKFIMVNGETYDLDDIEHGIIRKKFNEPRIHFALVCAAISCPPLLNEAFEATKLDQQLQQQARKFLSNTKKNIVLKNSLEISKIFQWYKGDFTKEISLQEYIQKIMELPANPKASVKYMPYNWGLNEQ